MKPSSQTEYADIAARFAADTAGHRMTVLHDDGVYRHLLFRDPKHSFYWFELITTPGQLVFSGDNDSYVFRRTTDMFQFFRSGIYRDSSLHINPGYWSEKLASSRDAATSYSEKLFEAEVAETLTAVEDDYPGIAAAWSEHVASEFNTEYEEEALRALSEFRFGEAYLAKCSSCVWEFEADSYSVAAVKARGHRREAGDKHTAHVRDLTFTFSDMGEMRLQDFDWWFLWACQAIVWGIARYDRVRRYGLQALATPKPDGLRARVAELEAERHSTNESLDDAVQALREAQARLAEYERPADEDPIAYALTEQADAAGYAPALPWAKLMDADDLEGFLADLVDAASGDDDLSTLAEVEDAIARWRVIGEAQHAHNTAPGPDAEDDVTPQVAKLRALLAGQRQQTGGA